MGAIDLEPVRTEQLIEGPTVTVRQMCPDDQAALLRFHDRLSDQTTYLRYFQVHRTLRPEEAHRFSHVDHRDREAFVATDDDGEIVGVGRYDRQPGTDEAEAAFVIEDAWQGLGLGPVLLRHLASHAKQLGVARLRAETLAINRPMLTVFRRSGFPMTTNTDDGVVHVLLDLTADPSSG